MEVTTSAGSTPTIQGRPGRFSDHAGAAPACCGTMCSRSPSLRDDDCRRVSFSASGGGAAATVEASAQEAPAQPGAWSGRGTPRPDRRRHMAGLQGMGRVGERGPARRSRPPWGSACPGHAGMACPSEGGDNRLERHASAAAARAGMAVPVPGPPRRRVAQGWRRGGCRGGTPGCPPNHDFRR